MSLLKLKHKISVTDVHIWWSSKYLIWCNIKFHHNIRKSLFIWMLTDFDFWSKHSFSRNIQKKSYNVKPANLLIFLFIWKQSVVWPFRPAMRACRGGAWGRLVVMIWYHAQICVNHGGGAGTGVSLPAAPQPARKRTGWVIHGVGGHMSCSGLLNDLKRFTSSASPSLPPPSFSSSLLHRAARRCCCWCCWPTATSDMGIFWSRGATVSVFPPLFLYLNLRSALHLPPHHHRPIRSPSPACIVLLCSAPFFYARWRTPRREGDVWRNGGGGGILPCPLLHPTLAVCYFEKGGGGGLGRLSLLPADQSCRRRRRRGWRDWLNWNRLGEIFGAGVFFLQVKYIFVIIFN